MSDEPTPGGDPAVAAVTAPVDVSAAIERSRFGRIHLQLTVLCGFTIFFDGYDLAIYGATLPRMIDDLGISPAVAGSVASAALVGMMVGAIVCGTVADRVGRKAVIIGCVLVYSVCTGAVFWADGLWSLAILRFLAGLGIGGVMPNAVALVAEYAPKRLRTTLVSIMFSGYMIGGIVAALLSIMLIPAFGWRSMFLIGATPLLLVPVMARYLPESPLFLVRKGRLGVLATLLRTLEPTRVIPGEPRFIGVEQRSSASSVALLFRHGRARGTVSLWVAFFMVLLMIYGLSTWLPQLMVQAGYSVGTSLSFLLTLYVAGTVITWVGGFVADRFGARRVLLVAYLVAAVFVATLGVLEDSGLLIVYAAVALGGGATFAAQIFANAYAAQFYPAQARATGVGWALGVGRVGAIIGPMLGGLLLTAQVSLQVSFLAFAIPGLVAALAVASIGGSATSAGSETASIPERSLE